MNDTPATAKFPRDIPQTLVAGRSGYRLAAFAQHFAVPSSRCAEFSLCRVFASGPRSNDRSFRMTNSQRLATVRDHLRQWLAENCSPQCCDSASDQSQSGEAPSGEAPSGEAEANETGVSTAKPGITSEAIMIRDGFYAGRTFEMKVGDDPLRAVWFMEPDELKISDSQGNLVAAFQGDEIGAVRPVVETVDAEEAQPTVTGPISIPMPAADESVQAEKPSTVETDSDDDQMPKAA